MKSKILGNLLILVLLLLNVGSVAATAPDSQAPTAVPTAAPTLPAAAAVATPTPAAPARPNATIVPHQTIGNCDVCGYCNGMTLQQVPARWQSCRQCIYRGLGEGEVNPLENKTLINLPSPDLFHIYTDFGCLSSKPGEFASQISTFFFSVVGGIAFMFFIYGAGVIATSRSDPGRLNQGRRIIYGAIVGLLFALFSVFLLRFIATGVGLPGLGS